MVVVNGAGGLDDARLESRVRLVRLPRNLGPAGGFGAGMEVAFADPSTDWAYLCEDDVGLFSLPSPRLADRLTGPRPVAACLVRRWGRWWPSGDDSWAGGPTPSTWSLQRGALTSWFRSM